MPIVSIIQRAMRLLGLLDSGEDATATEVDDALVAYNGLMGMWSNRGWLPPGLLSVSTTVGAPTSSIPISGSVISVESVSVSIGGVKANIPQGSLIELESVPLEYTSTWPRFYYFDPATTDSGSLRFPQQLPTGAIVILYFKSNFAPALTSNDTFPLTDRYLDAVTFSLAVRIAAEYNITPSVVVAAQAQEALDAIRELKQQQHAYRSSVDPALSNIGGRIRRGFDGIRGGW